LETSVDR